MLGTSITFSLDFFFHWHKDTIKHKLDTSKIIKSCCRRMWHIHGYNTCLFKVETIISHLTFSPGPQNSRSRYSFLFFFAQGLKTFNSNSPLPISTADSRLNYWLINILHQSVCEMGTWGHWGIWLKIMIIIIKISVRVKHEKTRTGIFWFLMASLHVKYITR